MKEVEAIKKTDKRMVDYVYGPTMDINEDNIIQLLVEDRIMDKQETIALKILTDEGDLQLSKEDGKIPVEWGQTIQNPVSNGD